MPEWIPMFAMPNVQPQNPIEIDGIAFVSVFDDRIKTLRIKYPNYDSYLDKFSDEFGVKLNPSTIMVRNDTPPLYKRVDALASYRDAISIASISQSRNCRWAMRSTAKTPCRSLSTYLSALLPLIALTTIRLTTSKGGKINYL
jgi:hypothetical protein